MQGGSECAWVGERAVREEIVACVAFVTVTRESFYADDFGGGKGDLDRLASILCKPTN